MFEHLGKSHKDSDYAVEICHCALTQNYVVKLAWEISTLCLPVGSHYLCRLPLAVCDVTWLHVNWGEP